MSKALEAAKQRAKEAAEKVKQLEAKEERAKARELYAFTKQRRLNETREKILMGALAQHLMSTDPNFKQQFMHAMHGYFKRPDDRALLGLPELAERGAGGGTPPGSEALPGASTPSLC